MQKWTLFCIGLFGLFILSSTASAQVTRQSDGKYLLRMLHVPGHEYRNRMTMEISGNMMGESLEEPATRVESLLRILSVENGVAQAQSKTTTFSEGEQVLEDEETIQIDALGRIQGSTEDYSPFNSSSYPEKPLALFDSWDAEISGLDLDGLTGTPKFKYRLVAVRSDVAIVTISGGFEVMGFQAKVGGSMFVRVSDGLVTQASITMIMDTLSPEGKKAFEEAMKDLPEFDPALLSMKVTIKINMRIVSENKKSS